jgi:hypothetical protein
MILQALEGWMTIRMLLFSYLVFFKRKEENFVLYPVQLHITSMSIISLILLPQKQTPVPKQMDAIIGCYDTAVSMNAWMNRYQNL